MTFILSLFNSCEEKIVKKEQWAVIIDFFSPDPSYYPVLKKFPFPDSLQFVTLQSFFTNRDKAPIITDSTVVFYDTYKSNDQKLCCKADTLELYTDTIKGKKYLFVIGEYVTVLSDTGSASNTRIRKSPSSIAFYGVQLNASYPPEKFKEEHEKLATRFVKIDERIDQAYRQKWNDNDSILVETIQFNNSNDRIITQVYKDMDEHEVDSTIGYLKQRFPQIEYQEGMKRSIDGIAFKNIRMRTQGISISIAQNSATQYSFTMTDYLETIKLIIRNAASGYVFRDDIKIY